MEKVIWKADPTHSEITFKVKHMMITNVTGILSDYDITAESDDEHFLDATITFKGKATSISTGNQQRDEHLRSAEFFDVEKNPDITFKSTKFIQQGETYTLQGDLTIKGVTKNITLNVDFNGMQKDPWGKIRAGFVIKGSISRKEFGLTWNTPLETGGVMVSDDVRIACEIQMVRS
jgi:polyisoprenoid-binding protein YceI